MSVIRCFLLQVQYNKKIRKKYRQMPRDTQQKETCRCCSSIWLTKGSALRRSRSQVVQWVSSSDALERWGTSAEGGDETARRHCCETLTAKSVMRSLERTYSSSCKHLQLVYIRCRYGSSSGALCVGALAVGRSQAQPCWGTRLNRQEGSFFRVLMDAWSLSRFEQEGKYGK